MLRASLLLVLVCRGFSQTREPLEVFVLRSDPETIYRGLRTKSPVPVADCKLLDLWECHPGNGTRIQDISLRWVNLDKDPELEAILISEAPDEWSYVAAIFDRGQGWHLVGTFMCHRQCRVNTFANVYKLTDDSPPLLFLHRDLGGSDGYHLALEGFHLRAGRLWPVIEFTQQAEAILGGESISSRDRVYAKEKYLVIHHREIRTAKDGWKESCSVKQWNAKMFRFEEAPERLPVFCDTKTGRPIPAKSWLTALPTWPDN